MQTKSITIAAYTIALMDALEIEKATVAADTATPSSQVKSEANQS